MTTGRVNPGLDFPQGPPRHDVPNWSENYVWTGYNTDETLFLYIHLGRWPSHPDWWEGVVNIVLPDGSVLAAKTFARSERPEGPDVNGLRVDCLIPMARWRVQFEGMCHRMTPQQNRSEVMRADLPIDPVHLDLQWERTGPVWSMHHDQPWSDGRHYEQHGQVRGVLRHGTDEVVLDGFGHRDHSLGPRDTTTFVGHTWLAAHFPESNRSLIVMHIRDRSELRRGMVSVGDELSEATIEQWPSWRSGTLFDDEKFTVAVRSPLGDISAEVRRSRSFWWTVTAPAGMHPGIDAARHSSGEALPFLETSLVLDCDGEIGYGFAEISRRFPRPSQEASP
jgi:hypothetical protein